MRYFLICDNADTLTGMRLAGIEGTMARTPQETQAAIRRAKEDPDIAILLINEKLAAMCPDLVSDLKMNSIQPLVVEIPDRHHTQRTPDSITRYIREAIGVKV